MTPAPVDWDAGSLESFTAVVDAIAAEHDAPRAEIIRRMIEELEGRIVADRAVIAILRRLERHSGDPALDEIAWREGRTP
jgi:hypothetical protein